MSVSRNAVISACYRNKIQLFGVSVDVREKIVKKAKVQRVRSNWNSRPMAPPKLERESKKLPLPPSGSNLISIMDLHENVCRWPIDERDVVMYCGAETTPGTPYCLYHFALSTERFKKVVGESAVNIAPVHAESGPSQVVAPAVQTVPVPVVNDDVIDGLANSSPPHDSDVQE